MANGAASGILGLSFWIAAARLFGSTALGRNSSLISAMLTVSGLAQLNYTRAMSSLIPTAREKARSLVGRVYVRVGIISLISGAVVAAALPHISTRFSYLRPPEFAIPCFAVAIVLWSIFTLEDTVLASARKAAVIPFENAVFGLAKLGLLFLFSVYSLGKLSIFLAWIIPLILIVIPINIFNFQRALPALANIPAQVAKRVENWVRQDFAGYILWTLGTSPLPFLVLAVLGPNPAASFYIPLTVATSIDVVTLNVGNAITAEVTRRSGRVERHAARFVAGYWLLVIVGSIVIVLLATTILVIFGKHYKSGSGIALRLLVAASAARAAMFLTNALARAEGKGGRILLIQATSSILTLAIGIATMKHMGVKGMALGWLVGSVAAGIISLRWLLPTLWRAFRTPPLPEDPAGGAVVTATDNQPLT